MWRILILAGLLACLAPAAHAIGPAWQLCQGSLGPTGPVLSACAPAPAVIDPQGRELWLRAAVPPPDRTKPQALHVIGAASSQAWLNGQPLDANGRPGPSAGAETPGRYEAAFPIRDTAWRAGHNDLVLRLSSFHGGLRLARPIGATVIADYPLPSRAPLLAVTLVAAGALFAAAFGFGVIHLLRRTGSSLLLAAMAGAAALQAVVESLRPLVPYLYPFHAWRLAAIWLLAAAFAVLLVAWIAGRFLPGIRRWIVAAAVLIVAATWLVPGFDTRTGLALLSGVGLALGITVVATLRRPRSGAVPPLAWLSLFIILGLAFPAWLVDLSYVLLVAALVLPLLMIEVIRLGRDDQDREAALTRAASKPDRLTVASARGVELVPVADILAVVGADDYAELRLAGGRNLLHAARLDQLEAQLPAGFLRIHRSAIVNLARVKSLDRDGPRWRLSIEEGPPLPVSRSRLATVRDALH